MWIAVEETKSLTFAVAVACAGSVVARERRVSRIKLRTCGVGLLVGNKEIQMHGGIG